ncbi:hypothetical protein F971_02708 [Acinetobacter vivianii]|uniref:DUF3899 domain-containing protein n=1 Tax=Acinetobacter vivianii TaxID=1776742 RepID=N8UVM4_9GAMM|nr:hypothetical protein [Acinetobacter vivianii]ENU91616.1 hypothetical protein F971_02708 [Acinetobacter vivianii]
MFIFEEGREAYNKIMTTILAQIIFGGIAFLFLYKSNVLKLAVNYIPFYIFTIFLWFAFALWIVNAYIEFNNSYKRYLYPKVKSTQFLEFSKNEAIKFSEIWKRDKKLAIEYILIQVLVVGILMFICFGSILSAVQIAEGAKIQ